MRLSEFKSAKLHWGLVALAAVIVVGLGGCTVIQGLGGSEAPTVAPHGLATPIPSPSPVVVSTPAKAAASGDSAVAGSATNRRLSTSSMTYNGEIMAESIVPVVAQAAGQIEEVKVAVGDSVHKGDLVARIDSKVAEAQRAQAQAALELTQSQLELAKTQPKKSDLDAAQAAVERGPGRLQPRAARPHRGRQAHGAGPAPPGRGGGEAVSVAVRPHRRQPLRRDDGREFAVAAVHADVGSRRRRVTTRC